MSRLRYLYGGFPLKFYRSEGFILHEDIVLRGTIPQNAKYKVALSLKASHELFDLVVQGIDSTSLYGGANGGIYIGFEADLTRWTPQLSRPSTRVY